jgi:hypothetical protein
MNREPTWSTKTIRLNDVYALHTCTLKTASGQAHCSGIVSNVRGDFSQLLTALGRNVWTAELELTAAAWQVIEEGGGATFLDRT